MNETGNKPVAYKLVCLLNSSRHQLQVTDEPVVDGLRYNRLQFLQDFRKISHRFRGIYSIYLKSLKKTRKMSTCNWLDLESLGS